MVEAYCAIRSAQERGHIDISTFPYELRTTLRQFDMDDDNTISGAELARAVDMYGLITCV